MSKCMFNITPRMVNIHTFHWLKDYATGAILLHTALNAISITLKEDYDEDEWMDLMFHMVVDPGYWHDVEEIFLQELGITEPGAYSSIDSVQFSNTLCQSCTFHHLKYRLRQVIRIQAPMPQALKSWVHIFSSIHCGCLNLCPELHSPSEITTMIRNQKLSSGTCYVNFDVAMWTSFLRRLYQSHVTVQWPQQPPGSCQPGPACEDRGGEKWCNHQVDQITSWPSPGLHSIFAFKNQASNCAQGP